MFTSGQSRIRPLSHPPLAMVLMTLGAWLVAFVVVLALLTLLGDELKSLPLAVRALVISGVLVSLMANLVMPLLNLAIMRWLSGGPMSGRSRERPSLTLPTSSPSRARDRFEKEGGSTGVRG